MNGGLDGLIYGNQTAVHHGSMQAIGVCVQEHKCFISYKKQRAICHWIGYGIQNVVSVPGLQLYYQIFNSFAAVGDYSRHRSSAVGD